MKEMQFPHIRKPAAERQREKRKEQRARTKFNSEFLRRADAVLQTNRQLIDKLRSST